MGRDDVTLGEVAAFSEAARRRWALDFSEQVRLNRELERSLESLRRLAVPDHLTDTAVRLAEMASGAREFSDRAVEALARTGAELADAAEVLQSNVLPTFDLELSWLEDARFTSRHLEAFADFAVAPGIMDYVDLNARETRRIEKDLREGARSAGPDGLKLTSVLGGPGLKKLLAAIAVIASLMAIWSFFLPTPSDIAQRRRILREVQKLRSLVVRVAANVDQASHGELGRTLIVRTAPDWKAAQLGRAEKGRKAWVLTRDSGWSLVWTHDDDGALSGWIRSGYLR